MKKEGLWAPNQHCHALPKASTCVFGFNCIIPDLWSAILCHALLPWWPKPPQTRVAGLGTMDWSLWNQEPTQSFSLCEWPVSGVCHSVAKWLTVSGCWGVSPIPPTLLPKSWQEELVERRNPSGSQLEGRACHGRGGRAAETLGSCCYCLHSQEAGRDEPCCWPLSPLYPVWDPSLWRGATLHSGEVLPPPSSVSGKAPRGVFTGWP